MRRAGRIFFNLLMAFSLLLFLATVTVWVQSYRVGEYVHWFNRAADRNSFDKITVWSSRGGLLLSIYHADMKNAWEDSNVYYERRLANQYPTPEQIYGLSLPPNCKRYSAFGFELIPKADYGHILGTELRVLFHSLTLPFYFLSLLFALLPAHYFLSIRCARRQARRLSQNRCLACGYDLRASPDRCPECGLAKRVVP